MTSYISRNLCVTGNWKVYSRSDHNQGDLVSPAQCATELQRQKLKLTGKAGQSIK